MVHVHVGQHHVGDGCEIDAGGLQAMDQPPGLRQVQVRVRAQPGVDEDGLAAAAHQDLVQRPVDHVRRQELVLQPGPADGRLDIVCQGFRRDRQHAVADHQHVDLADLQRVARRNQLVERRPAGLWGVSRLMFVSCCADAVRFVVSMVLMTSSVVGMDVMAEGRGARPCGRLAGLSNSA